MSMPFYKSSAMAIFLMLNQFAVAAESLTPVADHFLTLGSQTAADVQSQIETLDTVTNLTSLKGPVTATDALAALDQANIEKALVVSAAHLFSMPDLNPSGEYPLVKQENDYIAQQVAADPARLAGICSLNPLSDFALDEAQRCAQRLNLNGLYIDFYSSDINLRSSVHIGKLKELIEFLKVLQFPLLLQVQTRSETYGSVDIKLLIDNVLSEASTLDIQIAKFAGHSNYDVIADRAMGEFIEAFEDGRLEPSRFQFGLANTINIPQSSQSSEKLALMERNNRLLLNRIRQLDIRQVLFASNEYLEPELPTDSAVDSTGRITTVLDALERHLGLTPQEWELLLKSESRLFD